MYIWQDEEVTSDDINVRRGDSSNSSFSGDGAGPSSPGISTDVSIVPNRLGISIDLSNLSHCPTTPAPSTSTAGTTVPLRGVHLWSLWDLQNPYHLQPLQKIF